MTIGASLFLLAVGAILAFAVTAGIELQVVGVILTAVGVTGLVLGSRRRAASVSERYP
jgi:uncharacterized membrane protein